MRVLVVDPRDALAPERLAGELEQALRTAGAVPPRIDVELAPVVTRTP